MPLNYALSIIFNFFSKNKFNIILNLYLSILLYQKLTYQYKYVHILTKTCPLIISKKKLITEEVIN